MPLTREQRRRRIERGMNRVTTNALRPGELGALQNDGTYTVPTGFRNQVYVRLLDKDEELAAAWNLTVKNKPELPVWVRETLDGLEIAGVRAHRADEWAGDGAAGLNTPTIPGAYLDSVIPARNREEGRVRLSVLGTLVVHVEPFWYRYHGAWKRWPGGTVNLSAYLPSTTDYWHWAMIGVWGYDNSIQVVTGTENALYANLNDTTLDDLSADIDGLVPCDAVKLQEGMTSVDREEYYVHGRLLAAEVGLASVPDEITSAYYHLPAGRKMTWPESLTINGGIFTIEGTVIIR